MKKLIFALFVIAIYNSCKKNKNDCIGITQDKFGFETFEYVLDSMLKTDTAYINRDILFKANSGYSDISWKIGNDSRNFINNESVNLRFDSPESIDISLKATALNNKCIQTQYETTKNLVLLKDDGSILSPLIGSYKGYNVDEPNDTFTVTIKFWFGSRYNWWLQGAYSVENLPKGFSDSGQNFNGYSRPEIRGIIATAGYKNIAIDKRGNIPALGIKGYGSLKQGAMDSLTFNYLVIDTAKLSHYGELFYITKQFIGIKN